MSERTFDGFINEVNAQLIVPMNEDQVDTFRTATERTGDLLWVSLHWDEFLKSAKEYADRMGQPFSPSWYATFGKNKNVADAVMSENIDYLFALGLD